ncbi:MAG: hypothetical protein HQK49_09465 [Oligoflexia bacterium]|nr:hypothetical protein [Oligoflexia bacterium]
MNKFFFNFLSITILCLLISPLTAQALKNKYEWTSTGNKDSILKCLQISNLKLKEVGNSYCFKELPPTYNFSKKDKKCYEIYSNPPVINVSMKKKNKKMQISEIYKKVVANSYCEEDNQDLDSPFKYALFPDGKCVRFQNKDNILNIKNKNKNKNKNKKQQQKSSRSILNPFNFLLTNTQDISKNLIEIPVKEDLITRLFNDTNNIIGPVPIKYCLDNKGKNNFVYDWKVFANSERMVCAQFISNIEILPEVDSEYCSSVKYTKTTIKKHDCVENIIQEYDKNMPFDENELEMIIDNLESEFESEDNKDKPVVAKRLSELHIDINKVCNGFDSVDAAIVDRDKKREMIAEIIKEKVSKNNNDKYPIARTIISFINKNKDELLNTIQNDIAIPYRQVKLEKLEIDEFGNKKEVLKSEVLSPPATCSKEDSLIKHDSKEYYCLTFYSDRKIFVDYLVGINRIGDGADKNIFNSLEYNSGTKSIMALMKGNSDVYINILKSELKVHNLLSGENNGLAIIDSTNSGSIFYHQPRYNGALVTKNKKDISEKINFCARISMVKDMIEGLINVHTKKIIHADIKPENILYLAKNSCEYFVLSTPPTSLENLPALQFDNKSKKFYTHSLSLAGNIETKELLKPKDDILSMIDFSNKKITLEKKACEYIADTSGCINGKYQANISDFGTSFLESNSHSINEIANIGTHNYFNYDAFKKELKNYQTDTFALGATIFEFETRIKLADIRYSEENIKKTFKLRKSNISLINFRKAILEKEEERAKNHNEKSNESKDSEWHWKKERDTKLQEIMEKELKMIKKNKEQAREAYERYHRVISKMSNDYPYANDQDSKNKITLPEAFKEINDLINEACDKFKK